MTSPDTHEALVRKGRAVQVAVVATPSPEPGGLLVALSYVGICGTDLQILNGSRPDTADILGHEGVGTVVGVGEGAPLAIGTPVIFNPAAELPWGRILGHNTTGLFQRYLAVSARAIDHGLVVAAAQGGLRVAGALVEPLAAVIYAHELILNRVPDLRTAIIFGAGPIGLLATAYLREMGTKAFLVHGTQSRLNTAVELGLTDADATIVSPDEDRAAHSHDLPGRTDELQKRVLAVNHGTPIDAAVICTTRAGAPAALCHAMQVVRDAGCIDLVANYPESASSAVETSEALRAVRAANVCGVPKEGRYLIASAPGGKRIALTGHRGTSCKHIMRAMQLLELPGSVYARIVTHILSLREAAAALESLARTHQAPADSRSPMTIRRDRSLYGRDCIKAVIDMNAQQA